MTIEPKPRVAAFLCALTLAACGDSPATRDVESVDSAGVTIVRNVGQDRPAGLALAAEFTLGGKETEEESFYVVNRATVATDGLGNIAVMDRTNHRVLVFDSAGRFVRSMGRQGDGPGELGWPISIEATDDGRVLVFDISRRGFVAFGLDGGPAEPPTIPGNYVGGGLALDTEAVLLVRNAVDEQRSRLLRFGPAGDSTLIAWVATEPGRPIRLESCGMGFSGMPPLFSNTLRWASGGGVVAVSGSTDYVIDVYREGRHLRSVRREVPARVATAELAVAEVGDGMRVGTPTGERVCDSDEVVEERGFAEVIPAVEQIAVAPDGSIWAQRWTVGEEPPVIDLFGPEGAYRGTLPAGTSMPVGFLPDGRVLWQETDEFDVERLAVGRLEAVE